MKLVRVYHVRCGEREGNEYFLVPDTMPEANIEEILTRVKEEMIEDATKVKVSPLKPPYQAKYSDFPTSTVREVEEAHAALMMTYKSWVEENKELTRTFGQRVRELGFLELWQAEEEHILLKEVNWGHNHGLDLKYERDKWDA